MLVWVWAVWVQNIQLFGEILGPGGLKACWDSREAGKQLRESCGSTGESCAEFTSKELTHQQGLLRCRKKDFLASTSSGVSIDPS